jgi:hypothetical protein
LIASTPLHKQKATKPRYAASAKVGLWATRKVAPMAIMNSIRPLSTEMKERNPLTQSSIPVQQKHPIKSFRIA